MLFTGLLVLTMFNLDAARFNVRFCNVTPEMKVKDENGKEETTKVIFSGADIYYKVVRDGKVLNAGKEAAEGDEFLFYKKEEKLGPRGQKNLDSPNQIGGVSLPGTKDTDEIYITKVFVKGQKISNNSEEEVTSKWGRQKPIKMMHNDVFYIEPFGPELAEKVETKKPEADSDASNNPDSTNSDGDAAADLQVADIVTATDQGIEEVVVVEGSGQPAVENNPEVVPAPIIDSDNPNRVGTGYRLRLGCLYSAK